MCTRFVWEGKVVANVTAWRQGLYARLVQAVACHGGVVGGAPKKPSHGLCLGNVQEVKHLCATHDERCTTKGCRGQPIGPA
jgi:hypothetical protein